MGKECRIKIEEEGQEKGKKGVQRRRGEGEGRNKGEGKGGYRKWKKEIRKKREMKCNGVVRVW